MRDPDLIVRAQQAASSLESAWRRWRNMHGLTGEPPPAVSSYVGYSLDTPWGQPQDRLRHLRRGGRATRRPAGPARLRRPGARVGQGQAGRSDAWQPARGRSGPGCPGPGRPGARRPEPGRPGPGRPESGWSRPGRPRSGRSRSGWPGPGWPGPGRPGSGAGGAGGRRRAARDPAGVRARPRAGSGQRGPAAVSGIGLVPVWPHAARAAGPEAARSRRRRADQPGRAPASRDRDAHRAGRLAGGRGLDGQPPGGGQRPGRGAGSGRARRCHRGRGIIGPGPGQRPGPAVECGDVARARRRSGRARPPRRAGGVDRAGDGAR